MYKPLQQCIQTGKWGSKEQELLVSAIHNKITIDIFSSESTQNASGLVLQIKYLVNGGHGLHNLFSKCPSHT